MEGREPLWHQPLLLADAGDHDAQRALGVDGTLTRTTTITNGLDTQPDDNLLIPPETLVPVLTALGLALTFVGLLVDATVFGALAAVGLGAGVAFWTWHTEADTK